MSGWAFSCFSTSLTLSLPEGSSPRVFVIEKDGYQPYVVRQSSAHGQVRVVAALSLKHDAQAVPSMAPQVPPPAAGKPVKTHAPAPKKPAASPPKPPSDIRLER